MTRTYIAGLVSVIVPVYNREHLVQNTIDSILGQTYPDVEIVAINDGSTDNSLEVLRACAAKNPGKVVVIDQPNAGQVRARNCGIVKAQGEFIAFLDSDDTWEPEKLALQIPLFRDRIGLVYCGIHEVDIHGRILKTVPCDAKLRGDIYEHLLVRNRMTGGTVVVSRHALESVGLFDERLNAAENWDLWIRIAQEYETDFVDQPLVRYLKHEGNMSSNAKTMTDATLAILQKHIGDGTSRRVHKHTMKLAYANYYYNLAVLHFSAEDYRHAYRLFLRCWTHKPLYADSAVRMLRMMLGVKANRWLSWVKLTLKGKSNGVSL